MVIYFIRDFCIFMTYVMAVRWGVFLERSTLRAGTFLMAEYPDEPYNCPYADAPAPVPSYTDAPAPAPSYTDAPAPVPSYTEAPVPVPAPVDAPAPVPSYVDAPVPVPSYTDAPVPVPAPAVDALRECPNLNMHGPAIADAALTMAAGNLELACEIIHDPTNWLS